MQADLDLAAKTAVAMLFGTFNLCNEPMQRPPERFERDIWG